MTLQQGLAFGLMAVTIAGFIWGRHDVERDADQQGQKEDDGGGDVPCAIHDHHPHGLPMSPFGRMLRKTISAAKITR